ncbi:MAG: hypothetical protein ACPHAS_01915 [Synechococcus sp.]
MTATVTLLSDFIDGTSMALMEDTNASDLNDFMTASQGRLWADVQNKRRSRGLTCKRRGPGTLYFCRTDDGAKSLEGYLAADTGSEDEAYWLDQMKKVGVEMAPHIGHPSERRSLLEDPSRRLDPPRGFKT